MSPRTGTSSSVRPSDVSAKLQRGISSPQFPSTVPGGASDQDAEKMHKSHSLDSRLDFAACDTNKNDVGMCPVKKNM